VNFAGHYPNREKLHGYVRFLDMPSKRSKFSEIANFLHAFTWDNQEPLKRPKTNQKP